MTGCRIKKVTCKKTGKTLDIIHSLIADNEQIEILQDALYEVRHGGVTAIGVFVKTHNTNWSSFKGRTDDLAAGVYGLDCKIKQALQEIGE